MNLSGIHSQNRESFQIQERVKNAFPKSIDSTFPPPILTLIVGSGIVKNVSEFWFLKKVASLLLLYCARIRGPVKERDVGSVI